MSLTQAMSRWKPLANGTMESMICSSETVQEVWSSRSLNAASLRSTGQHLIGFMFLCESNYNFLFRYRITEITKVQDLPFLSSSLVCHRCVLVHHRTHLDHICAIQMWSSNSHDYFQTVVRGGIKHYHAQRLHIWLLAHKTDSLVAGQPDREILWGAS